jgi:hypothetical protein
MFSLNIEHRTTNNEQRTAHNEQRTSNNESTNSDHRTTNNERRMITSVQNDEISLKELLQKCMKLFVYLLLNGRLYWIAAIIEPV